MNSQAHLHTHRKTALPLSFGLRLEVGEEGQLGDVVEDDHGGEQDDADERHLVDALFNRHGKVAAEGALDQQQEDHATVEDGEGQQVEHAQVDGDHGHGADQGHPSGLGGFVDDFADADGSGEALDRDVPLEHALEHIHDQQRVLLVEIQRGRDGFREWELFDLGRRIERAEAEVVGLGPVP